MNAKSHTTAVETYKKLQLQL